MPFGDVLLHTGDFTELGLPSEVKKFNDWLGKCAKPVLLPLLTSTSPALTTLLLFFLYSYILFTVLF